MRCFLRVVLSASIAVAACSGGERPSPSLIQRSQLTMGSELQLTAYTSDPVAALDAFEEVFNEFDRLDAMMTVWRDSSEIQRVNAAAGMAPVAVSREVREVLHLARQASEATDGKFDVTFAALSDIWRFDHDRDGRIPGAGEIAQRLPLVSYEAVQVDDGAGTVFISRPGVRVNLGGIGKGYAVDRGVALLRASGLRDFMVQSGGDMYVGGMRGDRPWRLGVQDPRGPAGKTFAELELSDATFSTSGDYERAFVRDGRRYHHIIDPDTGQPAGLSRSVTIVAASAAVADALSTGVFILGPEKGMALIERLPGVEGLIVSSANEVTVSSGLRARLALQAPPTDGP